MLMPSLGFWEKCLTALWADTMGEFGLGMSFYVLLNLSPIAVIIPDLFAMPTDGKQSGKSPHLLKCGLQTLDEALPLLFHLLSFGNVLGDTDYR